MAWQDFRVPAAEAVPTLAQGERDRRGLDGGNGR
jgi:hypothetical protein